MLEKFQSPCDATQITIDSDPTYTAGTPITRTRRGICTNVLCIFNGGVGGYCLMYSDAECGVKCGEYSRTRLKGGLWFLVGGHIIESLLDHDMNGEIHMYCRNPCHWIRIVL